MMEPFVVHFLISLILVVRAVSSTAQWKTLRPVGMTVGMTVGMMDGKRSFVLAWIVARWNKRPGKNKVEISRQPLHQAAQSEGCDCKRRQH